jgi:hypothetical protein
MFGSSIGVLVGGCSPTPTSGILPFAVVFTTISAALTLSVGWLSVPGLVVIALMFASGLALGASRTPRDTCAEGCGAAGQWARCSASSAPACRWARR